MWGSFRCCRPRGVELQTGTDRRESKGKLRLVRLRCRDPHAERHAVRIRQILSLCQIAEREYRRLCASAGDVRRSPVDGEQQIGSLDALTIQMPGHMRPDG